MNVQFVKLSTGEEFFADVEHIEEEAMRMKNAVVAVDDGSGGLSFIPYLPFVEGRVFVVAADDVMIMEDTVADISKVFEDNFGSKIVTPIEKKILLA